MNAVNGNYFLDCKRVGGIDLAGSPRRPSGVAIIYNGILVYADKVYFDDEIIGLLRSYNVCIVAIDAPLSHAKGYRRVDLKMKKRGFRVLPPGWRGMKMLVSRAIRIKSILESMGISVIETHPSSALKNTGFKDIMAALSKIISVNDWSFLDKGKDVVDAVIAASVAWVYVCNKAEKISDVDGAIFLLPSLGKK